MSRVASAASEGTGDSSITASREADAAKFQEIIDLLVAAGYFRARIQGLTPFDKVIGGLTWCITSSDFDVDVDVLFQENATIGAQIKLGEALVKVLKYMKCPVPLQSHQIRGLDYAALFQVIQWLVRKVMETRDERGEAIRRVAVGLFTKESYQLPSDVERAKREPNSLLFVKNVLDSHRPLRRLKRNAAGPLTPIEKVRATLLEYGGRAKLIDASREAAAAAAANPAASAAGPGGAAGSGQKEREREAALAAEEARSMEVLLAKMDAVAERAAVTAGGVQNVVARQADDIKRMAESHAELSRELEAIVSSGEGKAHRAEAHRRQVAALSKQIASVSKLAEAAEARRAEAEAARDAAQASTAKMTSYNERVVRETAKLEALETPENAKDIARLTALVMNNERLKQLEEQFRAGCKRQLADWKELMARLEREAQSSEENERMTEIEATYDADSAKHGKIRALLAAKNRDLALILRRLEDVPVRGELIQYERRFVELYGTMAAKSEETKKLFVTYNVLADTKTFLTKETTIVNSISETFAQIDPKKKGGADKLLQSMDDIVGSVKGNFVKLEGKHAAEKAQQTVLAEKLGQLTERQRAYFKAVSDFQAECVKNEELLAELNKGE